MCGVEGPLRMLLKRQISEGHLRQACCFAVGFMMRLSWRTRVSYRRCLKPALKPQVIKVTHWSLVSP